MDNVMWGTDYVLPQQVGLLGLLPWCYDSHLPEFETADSAPQLQICPQQTGQCNLALHCPQAQWSQIDIGMVLKQSCPSPTVGKITDVFPSPKNQKKKIPRVPLDVTCCRKQWNVAMGLVFLNTETSSLYTSMSSPLLCACQKPTSPWAFKLPLLMIILSSRCASSKTCFASIPA